MNVAFIKMCKMSQKQLKKYVVKQLRKTHNTIHTGDGYVFAKGTLPIMLVAHLDTVHEKLPDKFYYDQQTDSISSPNGIGGDDRCGVYMIFEIVKKYNCSVLFCEDEEIGGIGAQKFINTKTANELEFNYLLEFDRKGSNDAVFYDCDNPEFTEFITKDFYKEATGTFSDISELAPFFGCAAANLSCGYYNAHKKDEYVVFGQMERSIKAACDILERTTEKDKFEYIEAKHYYSNYYGGWYDDYNYYDNEDKYYVIEYYGKNGTEWAEIIATSEAEAIGKFCIEHPTIPFGQVVDICVMSEVTC